MITLNDWHKDAHASKYTGAFPQGLLSWLINWFNSSATCSLGLTRIQRMIVAEQYFEMPALAGVLKELEVEATIDGYFQTQTADSSKRVRQGIGVLVKLHMLHAGAQKMGKKGILGRRNHAQTPHPQTGYNTPRSFSKYFSQAERYKV